MATKNVTIGSVNDWMDGVIYNYPEPRYTAKLYLQGVYDPDEGVPSKTVNLNMGANQVDFDGFNYQGTLTVTALEGFKLTGFENTYYPDATFTLNDSELVYELTSDELNAGYLGLREYIITAEVGAAPEPDPDPIEPDTVTNNYLLTKDRFKSFQTELFNTVTVESVNNFKTFVTDYLSSAKLYPFSINPVNIWGEEAIKIRDYTFSTLGKMLNNDYIVINFGEIETPKINDNATDIVGVTCDLIMPFRQGVISLDPYKVIGKKVTIEGRLYITKGEITISVYDSNGINFNISNFSIGSDHILNSGGYSESNMFSPDQALTLVNKAYILIKTPIYDETPKVLKEGILNAETGRIEVTEVDLQGNILGDEKALIESLLKNGVILK